MRRIKALTVALGLSFALTAPAAAAGLKVTIRAFPAALGNPLTSVGQPASEIWGTIFDALTYIDGSGNLQPALATSWETPSPTRWVFHLRPNVRFQNDEPFDADAVIHTVRLLQTAPGKSYFVSTEVAGITAIRAINPLTVEITTAEPDAVLPKRLSIVFMVAPRAWQTLGPERFAQAPVGTGPFRLLDWGQGQTRARLAAAPMSWRKPHLDTLEFLLTPDSTARIQALMTGAADVALGLSADDLAQLPKAQFDGHVVETAAVFALALRNVGNPRSPLQDARVRRALNHAMNLQQIADVIFSGTVKPSSQGAQPSTWGYNPALKPYGYDPAKARQLLTDAGYPNGFALTFDVLTGFAAGDDALYQMVAADLAKIGVKVTLRAVPYAQWLQKYTSGAWGDTDGFSARWDAGAYYDTIRPIMSASCKKEKPFFCEPSLMADIDSTDRMFDAAERKRKLQEIMARLQEIAPAIWLVPSNAYVATAKKVGNFAAREHGVSYDALTLGATR